MKVHGSCHCKAVTFVATVNPEKVVICHCSDCQISAGSAFRTVVMSMPDGLSYQQGQAKEYVKVADSGNQRIQGFCVECGSSLFATSVDTKDKIYGIRLGCLAEREQLTPKAQIWCQSRQPWLSHLDKLKTFEQGPA